MFENIDNKKSLDDKDLKLEEFGLKDLSSNGGEYLKNSTQKKWIFLFFLIFLSILLFSYFKLSYKEPTCFDNIQNQNEIGVDCGGGCSLQCQGYYNDLSLYKSQIIDKGPDSYTVIIFRNDNIRFAPLNISFDIKYKLQNGQIVVKTYIEKGYNGQYIPFVYKDKSFEKATILEVNIDHSQNKFYYSGDKKEIPVKDVSFKKVESGIKISLDYENPYKNILPSQYGVVVFYNKVGNIIFTNIIKTDPLNRGEIGNIIFYNDTEINDFLKAEIYVLDQSFI